MNSSTVHLVDLLDEILVEIFNKLSRVDLLNSMLGLHQRLDRLLRDVTFTHSLDLTTQQSNDERCSLPIVMLDRLCSHILPAIHENINSLLVESSSMQLILLVAAYPNLHQLTFSSIESEDLINHLSSIKFLKILFNLCP
ncbi:unnamed protein product [Rotaria magnacalcarata]|uniref:Uncharacterized protein n=1 Tax=Rotaria magnacalcarata TaxID=392030 RepID=A0A817ADM0_9BILA|nr:unnamed protein product [Rotaria magnacalcarata]CAF1481057.1 unnamed protein product [Rotaria magnacalcarata]CAF2046181.1 unnamed protein product [Rotaria magnacalcarata]CAF2051954.1 unnamed protein product [Rotaria magnacalcarata]CAF2260748.1 unnamed protein product [Rotaria magnacalcarata]